MAGLAHVGVGLGVWRKRFGVTIGEYGTFLARFSKVHDYLIHGV